jgi:hypothetical protein
MYKPWRLFGFQIGRMKNKTIFLLAFRVDRNGAVGFYQSSFFDHALHVTYTGPPRLVRLPRPGLQFWDSICSYKKQLVKKIWGRILGLVWLKFAVAALNYRV